MFGRKYKTGRRSANPLFVIFRLFLSLVIFVLLLAGVYSAYKHFTGMDPLKLNPEALVINLLKSKTPQDVIKSLGSIKATAGIAKTMNKFFPSEKNQKVLGGQKIIPQDQILSQVQPHNNVVLRFLMIADSHNDNKNLAKALEGGKNKYPDIKFVLGLGDYSEVGTKLELKAAKQVFDQAGLRYFLIPGDHDLWDGRDKGVDPVLNFTQVFGPSFQSFLEQGFYFIMINNADNYLGLSDDQLNWLDTELENAKKLKVLGIFVFVHESLFHPSSDHAMGRVESKVKKQAKEIIYKLKSGGVKAVVAGDAHYFSQYSEPETGIFMTTIGAITAERNVQTPRYGVGEVMEDGSLRVLDVEIR